MKTSCLYLLLIGLITTGISKAQNLVPNGSFELLTNGDYTNPQDAFSLLEYWYPANLFTADSSTSGTPDLFDVNNPFPQSTPPNYWNVAFGAASGQHHVGFANILLDQGYRSPEAVGTPLNQALEAGAYYHIGLSARNKGVGAFFDRDPLFCVIDPLKELTIILDEDPVYAFISTETKNSFIDVSTSLQLRSESLELQRPANWHPLGSCFQAVGGEQYLGITPSTGQFSVEPPCEIGLDDIGAYYSYYFDIDDVVLTKLPTSLSFQESICEGESNSINIADLADLPIMQSEISYQWPDGHIGSVNDISEAGIYLINAVTDCNTIPITLEVIAIDCEPSVYVPNAFSPNLDGVNDELVAYIDVETPIIQYEFAVYNRWGAKVFSSNDPNLGWDGSFRGRPVESATYLWVLDYTIEDIELGAVSYQETGDVTLIR